MTQTFLTGFAIGWLSLGALMLSAMAIGRQLRRRRLELEERSRDGIPLPVMNTAALLELCRQFLAAGFASIDADRGRTGLRFDLVLQERKKLQLELEQLLIPFGTSLYQLERLERNFRRTIPAGVELEGPLIDAGRGLGIYPRVPKPPGGKDAS